MLRFRIGTAREQKCGPLRGGIADRITVLVYGEVIASDAPAAIRSNAAVQEAYLGTVAA